MDELLDIMRKLRDPETGCPWDVKQDFASIAPYTIEEAYEVADAIERNDMSELRDELGDLLLQVVFHAQMADEQNIFNFEDVADSINDKLIRRHPHVFADGDINTADEQSAAWDESKAREREARGMDSLMDGVPRGMPELLRAKKLQKRAAEAGFDWPGPEPVLEKFTEELGEVTEAIEAGDRDAMEDEMGDILFVAVNLARKLKVDPGRALRRANAKFEQRFRAMEQADSGFSERSLEQQEALWQTVKKQLKG